MPETTTHAVEVHAPLTLSLPSERKPDVFDSEDFDAVKFINQIYPDGRWR